MIWVKKLNKQTSRAIAYCYNALNFLFMEPDAYILIDRIYLHGSAARGSLTEKKRYRPVYRRKR